MAKNKGNDKKVEQITDMEVDFAQWFTDVCKKAQLIDYSSIKGVFIYIPYGYAIWENIQRELDDRFKATGHKNAYFPLLIPESQGRSASHGFAQEDAGTGEHARQQPLSRAVGVRAAG